MNTVLGPFHPHLEDALGDAVHAIKSNRPLSPLLILVPSDYLRRRLKICFAAKRRMNLLNVSILTFHQLYLRLLHDSQPASDLLPAEDSIIEEALAHWIRTAGPGSFLALADQAGGCGALWQTLRDLKDGGVQPAHLRSALDEDLCDDRDKNKLGPLVDLYESFTASCQRWGLCDYSDFVSSARVCVGSSPFLKKFERIFYYGFYDLTQVQLDVFQEIVRGYPSTLFFPLLRGHPAWSFAQRFYERHIQGLASDEVDLLPRTRGLALFTGDMASQAPQTAAPDSCAIISCSGPRDETLTAAKEILRLNRDEGLAFSEIGVVARTFDPYNQWIKEIFRDHRIPISTSAEEPLLQSPPAKALSLLIGLWAKDYLRSHFVNLVSSPFFNLGVLSPVKLTPRPDVWDILTRRLGITKGADQWTRLKRYLDRDFEFSAGEEENGEHRKITVASEQATMLWRLFTELDQDLSGLPAHASWSEYAGLWQKLLQKYWAPGGAEAVAAEPPHDAVQTAVGDILRALSTLDALGARVSLSEFVQTWQRWLERKSVPLSDRNVDGVAVLDAMAARGSGFRAVFVLGLNEGLFPRTIREDAFLRDRTRRVMETVLGYKVIEKLAAFDEEKLLFTLLAGAARERLYCLYQRSDDTGRALEPSWYLVELEQALSTAGTEIAKTFIPRGIREKKDVEPFRLDDFLLPEELAIRLSLEGEDPASLLDPLPRTQALYRRGSQLLGLLEDVHGELTPFDGVLGHLPEYWRALSQRGISPTALERYGRCPFQFFALNMLALRPLERPEEQSVIDSSELGKLIHRILKSFFQELIDGGFFSGSIRSWAPDGLLETTAQRIFREYEFEQPVGYPVVWELWQEQITLLLKEQVHRDLQDLKQSGRHPVALEVELKGDLPKDWGPAAELPFYGTLDRIDFDDATARYRVVDYKFTMRSKPSVTDTNLQLAAARGEKLQPPIYILLAHEFARARAAAPAHIDAAFYYLAPRWDHGNFKRQIFSAEDLNGSCGASLRETLSLFVKGIHDGLCFIQPGDACRRCDVAHVCRKNHLPTGWRTSSDPLSRAHAQAVKKKLS
ncbi:MAG TPA: PD-(D/E)XK nuclease family protein [Candidatus Binatia bacterium]|nr:PD-(D/E)XK nuclease family protein [Candidatus Binatia bacterium]